MIKSKVVRRVKQSDSTKTSRHDLPFCTQDRIFIVVMCERNYIYQMQVNMEGLLKNLFTQGLALWWSWCQSNKLTTYPAILELSLCCFHSVHCVFKTLTTRSVCVIRKGRVLANDKNNPTPCDCGVNKVYIQK